MEENGANPEITAAKPIIHDIPTDKPHIPSDHDMPMKNVVIVFASVIIVGILTGFGISYLGKAKAIQSLSGGTDTMSNKADVAQSAGIADKKTFKDSAEGVLEVGGHKESGVGSFRLIRSGGDSQTVYLTASTVDLSVYAGKKVRVYGETFASDKVAWLMDVGYIEALK
ncbi:hypothetical protein A3B02_00410 [Candidatus Roizmanbacteria bacterium RIFCSPLOWO2_01_FULL_42_14]|uniref:Uncharacterized protein n=4 Tax=Candidatus Roizmaniibacteriota TaxID=1752723 RepID=A0A1F7JZZ5_9BACT|nr:MAG: hypothetical protein A3D08_02610 [Candidatus Roizmanbacteria bacterium RIFCSPHIGHO2_02_FULL_43_11]OGK38815.1 MAG: hypothetical protein A3F32_01140 [Candidatus Roizmanbacteria bacterium RIFCSPHIGHO2_12_FULL_42_10]OGK52717.1 MAG: hypothetical protein A3B02_00410 [Candidatus Roizmanbacteria bacterium RIFCSPLOWO2_01_FULL_42_14]OGK61184.1 MAG: hypothetical protein A3I56_03770 [Candidatus Roizmanbacteria bacterium RIFCSPLOWO2_02_FULL_43_10]